MGVCCPLPPFHRLWYRKWCCGACHGTHTQRGPQAGHGGRCAAAARSVVDLTVSQVYVRMRRWLRTRGSTMGRRCVRFVFFLKYGGRPPIGPTCRPPTSPRMTHPWGRSGGGGGGLWARGPFFYRVKDGQKLFFFCYSHATDDCPGPPGSADSAGIIFTARGSHVLDPPIPHPSPDPPAYVPGDDESV